MYELIHSHPTISIIIILVIGIFVVMSNLTNDDEPPTFGI